MRKGCKGCKTATCRTLSVELPSGWSVKHYEGPEGFFGWLALQTVEHRRTLRDLDHAEAKALGPILCRLERGIYAYWKRQDIEVKRVYVMYFLEGQLEPRHEWHFHVHLVPRFRVLKQRMLKNRGREIDAYRIAKVYRNLPSVLDRVAFKKRHGEEGRFKKELSIVCGVVKDAGYPLRRGSGGE